MKILLVTVPHSEKSFDASSLILMEPLALEYIAAGVKKDHDVKLVDLRADTEPGLVETLESFKPDIIGCGAYTAQVNPAKKILTQAKKMLPGILTVVGGQHATVMPVDFFEKDIDIVVTGEGTHTFRKICECHEKKKSFDGIGNIYYKKNGEMVFTRKEEFPPLDSLPFPDRSLTSHLRDKYKFNLMLDKPATFATVRSSVGCFYRCKFCSVSTMMDHKLYRHSVDRVTAELESIEAPIIFWVDDEFLLQPDKSIELAIAIQKAGIKKYHVALSRSDTITKSPRCIEEWAKIGLKNIFIGMESSREVSLNAMRKGTTVSKNEEALRICHQYGVKVQGSFIVEQDFDKTDFKNLIRYVRKSGVDHASLSILTPFPGTELYEEKKGELITHNYDLFDMFHSVLPTKLSLKEFHKLYGKTLKNILPILEAIKIIRRLDPETRKRMVSNLKILHRRIKNAYLDFN